jgi:protein SCO1
MNMFTRATDQRPPKRLFPGCVALVALALVALAPFTLRAQQPASAQPALLRGVGISQQMNQQVPANLVFRDEAGNSVRLADYFGKKPIVLSLVYFGCLSMCTEVLNGELRALRNIPLALGKDYEAVTVSFDPKDSPTEAVVKKRIYTGLYGRPGASAGWHFLTGDQTSIAALTDAVGFRYTYDQPSGQFAHATAIMILTPQGQVARYFYGVQYPSRDVRLGLVEASQGKIGSPTDAALLFCYHYDPLTGKYGLLVANVLRIAGGLTILVLGVFLWLMFRRERHPPSPVPGLDTDLGH